MGSLIKILEGPKEELIDVDVSLDTEVNKVASVAAIGDCCWLG
jgi:hypothetical protein